MHTYVFRLFDSYALAEQARNALLADGFARDGVELTVQEDEAGPVRGNFIVGDHTGRTGEEDPVYRRNFAPSRQEIRCLITVAVDDPILADQAAFILQAYGGMQPASIKLH